MTLERSVWNTFIEIREKLVIIWRHLEDIPSKPEGGLQNKATRLLISLSYIISKQSRFYTKESLWDNISNCSVAKDTYFLILLCFLQSFLSCTYLKHLKSHSGYHEKDQIRTISIVHCPKKRLSLLFLPLNMSTCSIHSEIYVLWSVLMAVLCAEVSR